MTIKQKLRLSSLVLVTTFLVVGLTILFGYRYVTHQASLANDFDKEAMYLQMMLRGINESALNGGTPESIKIEKEGMEGFDVIHKRLLARSDAPEFTDILRNKIDPRWQKIKKNIEPFFSHYINLEDNEMMISLGKLITETNIIIEDIHGLSEHVRDVVNKNSRLSDIIQIIIIICGVFIIVAAIQFSRHLYKSIISPINELTTIAEGFNRGDLSLSMDESRNDEFGALAVPFNRSTAKLRQINQELQDFAHVASHDLQEPLRKILTFGDRLKTKYQDKLGEQGLDYLERMNSASERMQNLILGLLTYTRAGTKQRLFEPVDLNTVLQNVISEFEVPLKQTYGIIETEPLPTIDADEDQMRQLMQNLISNSLNFSKKNVPPILKIHGRLISTDNSTPANGHNKDLCQLTIEDNGIGFNERHSERIFSIFQRLHGKKDYEGTGIGLSICRRIVDRHNGNIIARSSPGNGATFIVSIPVNQRNGGSNGHEYTVNNNTHG